MDNLQYTKSKLKMFVKTGIKSFKTYYKWITFNTMEVPMNRVNASFEF